MTPSLQSHFFRLLSRALSAYLVSKGGVEEWRKLAAQRTGRSFVPAGVRLQRIAIGNVAAEWLRPKRAGDTQKVMLYFHGGAWLFGWYNPHRMLLGYIARQVKLPALAVDYRLAPEHPYPAALEDCLTAYRYLLENGFTPGQVVLAGDSAGGNLVITTMLALREAGEPLPAAGICISPATDLAGMGESTVTNIHKDAILSAGLAARLANIMPGAYGGGHDIRDPLISPIYGDLSGLPALLVQAGEDETLLSSITAFVNKARQDGVEVTYEVWPAMWHVWHIFAPFLPEARYAVHSMSKFIGEKLS